MSFSPSRAGTLIGGGSASGTGLGALEELINKEQGLKAALAPYFAVHGTPEKESLIELVAALSPSTYKSLYKKVNAMGFNPSLGGDGKACAKEKRRVGTFLFNLFSFFGLNAEKFNRF